MRTHRRKSPTRTLLALGLLFCGAQSAAAQAAPAEGVCKVTAAQVAKEEAPPAPDLTSGIRLKVLGGADWKTPVKRKRFYLLERSVREGGRQPDWSSLPRRADYLKGASTELQEWLKKHDCDSLYCPDYEAEYADAVKFVPEFKKAYEEGLKKYRNQKLALRWLTVNFPLKNVRTEYYKRKRAWIEQAASRAGKVTSVMTDEKGEAYFTGLKLKSYYVSNLVPLEDGNVVWDCAVTVPPPVPARLHSVSVDLGSPKAASPAPAK